MRVEVSGVEATIYVLKQFMGTGRHMMMARAMELFAETTAEAARPVTHVITGALRGSHTAYMRDTMTWDVTPNPGTINPFGYFPADYGPVEHRRGGSHAFYDRTIQERLPDIVRDVVNQISAEFGSVGL